MDLRFDCCTIFNNTQPGLNLAMPENSARQMPSANPNCAGTLIIAGPLRVACMPIARLGIVGGFDPFRRGGSRAVGLEADPEAGRVTRGRRVPRRPLVVALPGLTERANHG